MAYLSMPDRLDRALGGEIHDNHALGELAGYERIAFSIPGLECPETCQAIDL